MNVYKYASPMNPMGIISILIDTFRFIAVFFSPSSFATCISNIYGSYNSTCHVMFFLPQTAVQTVGFPKKAGHPKELEDDAYYGNELEDPRNCGWFPCAATSPLP